MRVVVAGGRDWHEVNVSHHLLDALGITELGHGGCRGADAIAGQWAVMRDVPTRVYKPDWSHGRAAGPIRNARMLKDFKPDLVLLFPGGRGTDSTFQLARKYGFPVVQAHKTTYAWTDVNAPMFVSRQEYERDLNAFDKRGPSPYEPDPFYAAPVSDRLCVWVHPHTLARQLPDLRTPEYRAKAGDP